MPKSHSLETSQVLMDTDAHIFSKLTGKKQEALFEYSPLVRKLSVEMSPPTVVDQKADHERLYAAIRQQVDAPIMQTGFRLLQKLSKVLRKDNYKAAVTIGQRGRTTEVIQVESGSRCKINYAVAVDIGTTTVVAHLIDLTTGKTIDREATYNSQMNFGEDYIRRIIYAEQANAFVQLQERLVYDVNDLIMTMAVRQRIDLQDISAVICAGNTTMIHFVLNLDPTRIRREPYVASAASVPRSVPQKWAFRSTNEGFRTVCLQLRHISAAT